MDENEILFDDLDIPAFDPFARLQQRMQGQQGRRAGGLFGGSDDSDEDDEDDDAHAQDDPDGLDDGRVRSARVVVEDDLITFARDDFDDVGVYQIIEQAMSVDFNYYEVEVMDWGAQGRIGIGLARDNYPLNRQPGWNYGSVAYHCDDGKLFQNSGFGRAFAAPSQQGDVIGCGIDYSAEAVRDRVRVFFTRNGSEIGQALVEVPPTGFFPTVGLHSSGESVRVNLRARWPPEQDDEMIGDDQDPNAKWSRLSKVTKKDGLLSYIGLGQSDSDGGIAQSCVPLTHCNHYFELEIVDSGDKGYVAIGIARQDYPTYRHPGWNPGSVAYHADDGKLFHGEGRGREFGPSCHQGDRMGCGVQFLKDDDDDDDLDDGESEEDAGEGRKIEVFFTRNGKRVGKEIATVPKGGFFPIIGMLSRGEKVRAVLTPLSG